MRSTGARYEDIALAHAERNGLRLVARNFNCRYGELDLVMCDGDVLAFIEVRYRRGHGFGGAVASVGASKRARLVAAARMFLQMHPQWVHHACRFDVVAIGGVAGHPTIEWLRDAFRTD
ncbi:MAG TPA: YraN family protein [Dokdonella sp.]|uniref:YraN family protein n=1 Tax=Dokdonella sp. TaxID=2291710 RepID=UPI0025C04E02|nr:YraN family protein [Dokdonella sp.]MBX3692446.1 YraN family protein [Dokdonella sp.]MCW5568053.1 YraN family protein [Dokdonella sp.]HNR92629.1 YraN family protein [Dokdonella sp.]